MKQCSSFNNEKKILRIKCFFWNRMWQITKEKSRIWWVKSEDSRFSLKTYGKLFDYRESVQRNSKRKEIKYSKGWLSNLNRKIFCFQRYKDWRNKTSKWERVKGRWKKSYKSILENISNFMAHLRPWNSNYPNCQNNCKGKEQKIEVNQITKTLKEWSKCTNLGFAHNNYDIFTSLSISFWVLSRSFGSSKILVTIITEYDLLNLFIWPVRIEAGIGVAPISEVLLVLWGIYQFGQSLVGLLLFGCDMSEVVHFCWAFDGTWILLLGFDFSFEDEEPYDYGCNYDDEKEVKFVVDWALVCVKSLDGALYNSEHKYYNSQTKWDHYNTSRT